MKVKTLKKAFSLRQVIAIVSIAVILTSVIAYAVSPAPQLYTDDWANSAYYTIKTDGSYYWAVRYDNKMLFDSTDFSSTFNSTIYGLPFNNDGNYPMRYGKIAIAAGDFHGTFHIEIPKYWHGEIQGAGMESTVLNFTCPEITESAAEKAAIMYDSDIQVMDWANCGFGGQEWATLGAMVSIRDLTISTFQNSWANGIYFDYLANSYLENVRIYGYYQTDAHTPIPYQQYYSNRYIFGIRHQREGDNQNTWKNVWIGGYYYGFRYYGDNLYANSLQSMRNVIGFVFYGGYHNTIDFIMCTGTGLYGIWLFTAYDHLDWIEINNPNVDGVALPEGDGASNFKVQESAGVIKGVTVSMPRWTKTTGYVLTSSPANAYQKVRWEGQGCQSHGNQTVSTGNWIAHSLVTTPRIVTLTPRSNVAVWVSSRNTTHFQVGVSAGSPTIDWYAEI